MGAGKSKKKVNVDSASSNNNNNDVDDSNNGTNENSYLDDDDFGDAPEFLVCPITQEVMDDPVITSDGHTFERSAIEAWLSNNNTNPMTGSEIKSKALTPNFALRDACAAYKAKQPGNADSIRRYKSAVSALGGNSNNSTDNKTTVQQESSSFFSSLPNKSEVKTSTNSNHSNSNSPLNHVPEPMSFKRTNRNNNSSNNNNNNFASSNVNNSGYTSSAISMSSSSSSSVPKCSLCEKNATAKSKVGNDWIKVCDDCRQMVAQQSQMVDTTDIPRRNSSFRPLSINEATNRNMEFKSSTNSNHRNNNNNNSNSAGSRYTVNTTNTNTSPYDSGQIKCYHCQINEATTRGKIANEFKPLCNNCFNNLSYLKQSENKNNNNFKKVSRLAPTSIEFKGSPKNSTSSNNTYLNNHNFGNQVPLSRRHTVNTSNSNSQFVNPRLSPPRKGSLQEESLQRLKETENNEWKRTTYTHTGRFDVAAANKLTDAINKKYG